MNSLADEPHLTERGGRVSPAKRSTDQMDRQSHNDEPSQESETRAVNRMETCAADAHAVRAYKTCAEQRILKEAHIANGVHAYTYK